MNLIINTKSFSFPLLKNLKTSQGVIQDKKGWLIQIKNKNGDKGWGEVSPISKYELKRCQNILNNIGHKSTRLTLENGIKVWPKSLAFGIGASLAELDSIIGEKSHLGWLKAPESAYLLNSKGSILEEVNYLVREAGGKNKDLTLKIKVGLNNNNMEKKLIQKIIQRLTRKMKIRIDVNGGWNFEQAKEWVKALKNESKVEWVEQPLPANNIDGLLYLSKIMPIAIDESLLENPSLINTWNGWQIRRPILEGDPRLLLKELEEKVPFRALSTTFETGIGKRWLDHLAALQQFGPTPTAPGLGPGWCPSSPLFSSDPQQVWDAA